MTILPVDPATNATPEALHAFLAGCRDAAERDGTPKLVSISLAVGALDPLAVLESIFEPGEQHFYVERPSTDMAVAGAEAVVAADAAGPERFATVQRFVDATLAHTIAVGDVAAPFGGPHFFAAFAFGEHVDATDAFPAARVFVPRWQVGRMGAQTTAVANLLVAPAAPLGPLTDKVWRAHARFRGFEYGAAVEPHPKSPPVYAWETDSADAYPRAVAAALERIRAGEFQKIVLARRRVVHASAPLHPLQMLNGLRQRFTDCYAFSVANGRGQSFIGASPERLARAGSGWIDTEALAGSAPRGATAVADATIGAGLLRSEKDRREHQLVLDSIRRRLAPLGLALEFPDTPALRRLANVQHLHTPLRAVLPERVRLLDVVARLHPTPAVGGTPRAAAVARIPELEGFSRGLYAGALGWLDSRGGGEFFVGLRSALVDGTTAQFHAGAGIVAGSDPEKEFAETELKFRAIQEALES